MEQLFSTECDGQTFTIRVKGSLDFQAHRAFRECYEGAPAGVTRYVVDLQGASRLDSSALGMLMLLRDYAGGRDQVQLRHAGGNVLRTLEVANFHALFDIPGAE